MQRVSEDERARADRFVYEAHKHRFVAAHAALRTVLGTELGVPPLAIEFGSGARGRPTLAAPRTDPVVHFSLSHSHEGCLIGLAAGRRIGVDIEKLRPQFDCQGIADRYFTSHEADMIRRARGSSQSKLFFGTWTRKEAYLKAKGVGLYGSLTALECDETDDGRLRVVTIDGAPANGEDWTVIDLDEEAFAACAVVEGSLQQPTIKTFTWKRGLP